jgi:hypothetical protein
LEVSQDLKMVISNLARLKHPADLGDEQNHQQNAGTTADDVRLAWVCIRNRHCVKVNTIPSAHAAGELSDKFSSDVCALQCIIRIDYWWRLSCHGERQYFTPLDVPRGDGRVALHKLSRCNAASNLRGALTPFESLLQNRCSGSNSGCKWAAGSSSCHQIRSYHCSGVKAKAIGSCDIVHFPYRPGTLEMMDSGCKI